MGACKLKKLYLRAVCKSSQRYSESPKGTNATFLRRNKLPESTTLFFLDSYSKWKKPRLWHVSHHLCVGIQAWTTDKVSSQLELATRTAAFYYWTRLKRRYNTAPSGLTSEKKFKYVSFYIHAIVTNFHTSDICLYLHFAVALLRVVLLLSWSPSDLIFRDCENSFKCVKCMQSIQTCVNIIAK